MALIISPRTQDIGFPINRLLPSRFKQRVGPFIFLDHMGPMVFPAGTTQGDVRPHPHIGLATVTYLFEGAMMHRDSLGNVQRIEPGAINLMSAGNGIVHSERVPDDIRSSAIAVQGIQTWLALPVDDEESEPHFQHYAADEIPQHNSEKLIADILIGEAFGITSPVKTFSTTTYIHLQLEIHAYYQHVSKNQELAVYVIKGHPEINSEIIPENNLVIFDQGEDFIITSLNEECRLLILGGEPLEGERFILWNFVASSKEKLQLASARWEQKTFGHVPGETEWIPLPK